MSNRSRIRMFFVTASPPSSTNTSVAHGNGGSGLYGFSQTFTATVTDLAAGPTPQGTVQFKDGIGGSNIGSPQTLDVNGQASISTSALSAGSHTIQAVYTPTDNHLSSSGTVGVMIYYQTSTSVSLNNAPVQYGATQILTATITSTGGGQVPNGSNVNFYVDNSYVGSATTTSGSASLNIGNSRNVGTYGCGAIYSTNGNYAQSGSINIGTPFTINQAIVTASSLSSSPNPSDYGQSWNLSSVWTSSTGVAITGTYAIYRTNSFIGNSGLSGFTSGGTDFQAIGGTDDTVIGNRTYTVEFNTSGNFASGGISGGHVHTQNKQDSYTSNPTSNKGSNINDPAPRGGQSANYPTFSGTVSYERGITENGVVTIYFTDSANIPWTLGTLNVVSGSFSGPLGIPAGAAAGAGVIQAVFEGATHTYAGYGGGGNGGSTFGTLSPYYVS